MVTSEQQSAACFEKGKCSDSQKHGILFYFLLPVTCFTIFVLLYIYIYIKIQVRHDAKPNSSAWTASVPVVRVRARVCVLSFKHPITSLTSYPLFVSYC